MALLDPKLDVVFKMLFAEPRNAGLLRSLLAAVLGQPIANATVLDPELPRDLASDRGVRLDVLVELERGKLVDVEMECDARRGHGARWLYHWARLFSARLRRGDEYDELEPVVCVVFLDGRTAARRFHSRYEAREAHDHLLLSDVLAVHVIELPRVDQALNEGERVDLERWARFLRFDDERALDSLAAESPIMAEAKHALEILSREPSAQRIAEMRRDAALMRRLDRAEDLAEGREQGLAEGREQGLAEGREQGARAALRSMIERFCETARIALDDERRALLATRDSAQLQSLLDRLYRDRAWPADG